MARKKYLLRLFQFKNETEAKIVLNLVFCGSLANVAFVFGRNAAPAMLISRLGAERLARAMFLSGVSIIAFTPLFSGFAKKRRATAVNACVLRSAAVTLASLYALLAWCGAGRGALIDNVVYSVFYVVEDLATLVVMMQNGAVTQELFSATDARRIVGLVQLGSSLGAVFAGLLAGSVAEVGGVTALILAQILALLGGLTSNGAAARLARQRGGHHGVGGGPAVDRDAVDVDDPWWRDALVVTLGAYTFLIIMVKTTLEYEYNVIVSEQSTAEEMVAMTGYLYAAAGTCASLLNLGGTRFCLKHFGLGFASSSYPLGLVACSLAIILDGASLRAALAARCLDLTARWSINNTFKSVMWIAVSVPKARAARPYVESMTKKVSAALVALALGAATAFGCGVGELTLLALVGCVMLFGVGVYLRRLYLEAMRHRVERRFVPLVEEATGRLLYNPGQETGATLANFKSLLSRSFSSRFG